MKLGPIERLSSVIRLALSLCQTEFVSIEDGDRIRSSKMCDSIKGQSNEYSAEL